MGLIGKQMREVPAFRRYVYIVWGIVAIIAVVKLCKDSNIEKVEFMPYSAKVVSFYTEKTKRGGRYYQRIKLDNKELITANGFTATINSNKVRLIDYIAIGDSVVCDSTDGVLYVYRAEAETYRFTYSPSDFK